MEQKGFTLMEVMLTMSILIAASVVTLSSVSIASQRMTARSSEVSVQNVLATASRMSRSGVENSDWGVYFFYDNTSRNADYAVLFSGASYATRDVVQDIIHDLPSVLKLTAVDFSGIDTVTNNDNEIIFSSNDGGTAEYGSMTLNIYEKTIILTISESGYVVAD